jgi:hypothetical protein
MIEVDSLVGNEFQVEIDGNIITGVFRIDGFVPFKLDAATGEQVIEPFSLVKMVQRDANNTINRWLRQTTDAPTTKPRRDVVIKAVDDDVVTRIWTAKGAWISEVRYHVFDSASSAMVEEIITVHYDSISESWPATANLE